MKLCSEQTITASNWLKTFKRRRNADGVSCPHCKQCWGKPVTTPWVDELDCADDLTEPLNVHAVTLLPEISHAELQQLQAEDSVLAPIINYLESDTTPTADDLRSLPLEAQNLWSQRPLLQLNNNVLVRQNDTKTQPDVPTTLRKRLYDHAHAGPLSAYLGAERTLNQ